MSKSEGKYGQILPNLFYKNLLRIYVTAIREGLTKLHIRRFRSCLFRVLARLLRRMDNQNLKEMGLFDEHGPPSVAYARDGEIEKGPEHSAALRERNRALSFSLEGKPYSI
jgi:hypothetical protein